MRQPLRRLESLLAACEELAIKPVLPCNESEHTVALCQEIGFDLVLTSSSSNHVSSRCRLRLPFKPRLFSCSYRDCDYVDRHPSV